MKLRNLMILPLALTSAMAFASHAVKGIEYVYNNGQPLYLTVYNEGSGKVAGTVIEGTLNGGTVLPLGQSTMGFNSNNVVAFSVTEPTTCSLEFDKKPFGTSQYTVDAYISGGKGCDAVNLVQGGTGFTLQFYPSAKS